MKTLADLCPAAYGPPDEGQNFTPPPRHPRGRGPGSNLSPGEVDGITVFGRLRQEDCQQHGAAVRLSQNQKNNKSLGFRMSKGLEAHDRVSLVFLHRNYHQTLPQPGQGSAQRSSPLSLSSSKRREWRGWTWVLGTQGGMKQDLI